jgi:GGDEF domain-containing protein
MCDIDMFKDINDRCGHDVGDIVLIDVAQIIRRVWTPIRPPSPALLGRRRFSRLTGGGAFGRSEGQAILSVVAFG